MKPLLLLLLLLLIVLATSAENRNDDNQPDRYQEMSLEGLQDIRAGEAQQQAEIIPGSKSTQAEIFMRTIEEQLQKFSSLFAA